MGSTEHLKGAMLIVVVALSTGGPESASEQMGTGCTSLFKGPWSPNSQTPKFVTSEKPVITTQNLYAIWHDIRYIDSSTNQFLPFSLKKGASLAPVCMSLKNFWFLKERANSKKEKGGSISRHLRKTVFKAGEGTHIQV